MEVPPKNTPAAEKMVPLAALSNRVGRGRGRGVLLGGLKLMSHLQKWLMGLLDLLFPTQATLKLP